MNMTKGTAKQIAADLVSRITKICMDRAVECFKEESAEVARLLLALLPSKAEEPVTFSPEDIGDLCVALYSLGFNSGVREALSGFDPIREATATIPRKHQES